MNAPKPINAMKHFGGGPEYGGKKKPGKLIILRRWLSYVLQ